ncbi:MAG: hypothetical protein HY327_10430 [Chloroflexi bacterium]|nr:hypothetical protein [Chloroflexota bacterium]
MPALKTKPIKKRTPARKKNISATLGAIELIGLIQQSDPAPDLAYRFKHTLTQETAYYSLLRENRRDIHRAIAECYEKIGAENLDEYAALLAQHYAEAGDNAKTIEYSIRAGDAAARVYALPEAVLHYARGLTAAKQIDARAELETLYQKLGRALELAGRYDEAAQAYEEMEKFAQEKSDRVLELAALTFQSTILCTPTAKYDETKGARVCERALTLARELEDKKSEARGLWNLMLLHGVAGRSLEAITFGQQSLALARELGLKEQIAYTLNDLGGFGYGGSGDLPRAIAMQDEARALWRELDNPAMLADNLSGTAQNLYMLGEGARGLAYAREAFEISSRIENLWGKSFSRITEGFILSDQHWGLSLQMLEQAIQLAEHSGFPGAQSMGRYALALLLAQVNDFPRACEIALEGDALTQAKMPQWRAWSLGGLARIHTHMKMWDAAEAYLAEALKYFDPSKSTLFSVIDIPMAQGEIAHGRGDFPRAIIAFEKAIETLTQLDYRVFIPEALYHKARVLRAQGDETHAYATLTEARNRAVASNSHRALWQILAALGEKEAARAILSPLIADLPDDLRASFFQREDARALMAE